MAPSRAGQTERGHLAPVHGRFQVCRVAPFARGNMEHYVVEALYLTTCSVPEPLGDDFVLGRNAWFDRGYLVCLSYVAFGRISQYFW